MKKMTKRRACYPILVFSNLCLPSLCSCRQNPTLWGCDPWPRKRGLQLLTSNTIGVQTLALPMVLLCITPNKALLSNPLVKGLESRALLEEGYKPSCTCQQATPTSKNILQIINRVRETIEKKKLVLPSNNVVCAVSGGQDSIFLLFCLSLLQPQIAFKCHIIWCNHFWQACSFYTTLHLTRSAVAFSSPIVGALPSQIHSSSLFYKAVTANYKKDSFCFSKPGKLLKKPGDSMLSDRFTKGLQIVSPKLTPFPFLRPLTKLCFVTRRVTKQSFVRGRGTTFGEGEQPLVKGTLRITPTGTHLLMEGCKSSCKCKSSCTCQQANSSVNGANHLIQKTVVTHQMVFTHLCFAYKIARCRSRPAFTRNGFGSHALFAKGIALFCMQDLAAPLYKRRHWTKSKTSFGRVVSVYRYKASYKTSLCKGYKRFVKAISEIRARNWRHITTERVCTFYDSNACVYGHTGSDRVETILFNLIRGSGGRGIATLPWKRRHSDFSYNRFFPSYKQVTKGTHLLARTNLTRHGF